MDFSSLFGGGKSGGGGLAGAFGSLLPVIGGAAFGPVGAGVGSLVGGLFGGGGGGGGGSSSMQMPSVNMPSQSPWATDASKFLGSYMQRVGNMSKDQFSHKRGTLKRQIDAGLIGYDQAVAEMDAIYAAHPHLSDEGETTYRHLATAKPDPEVYDNMINLSIMTNLGREATDDDRSYYKNALENMGIRDRRQMTSALMGILSSTPEFGRYNKTDAQRSKEAHYGFMERDDKNHLTGRYGSFIEPTKIKALSEL